jgi:electron transport complex protein RnfA
LFRFFPKISTEPGASSARTSYNGLVIAALLMTLRLASTFMEAMVLALGFSLGGLFSIGILKAIHKRSSLETVPAILRGIPLMLISMGLLSLIYASAAVILLRVLGIIPR